MKLQYHSTDLIAHPQEITNPTSPRYGEYLSVEEISALLSPPQHHVESIQDWLRSHDRTNEKKRQKNENDFFSHLEGVEEMSLTRNKDWITFLANVSVASELLDTRFFTFSHISEHEVVRSLGPYTAPTEIAELIDFLIGGIGFPNMEVVCFSFISYSQAIETFESVKKTIPITPQLLRQRYNVSTSVVGTSKNSQSVAEFGSNYFSSEDVSKFFDLFWPGKTYSNTVSKVRGTNDGSRPTPQTNMDVEYIMGVAPNVPTWVWINNLGADFWTDLGEWVAEVANTTNPPLVHAMTYGNQGAPPSQQYQQRLSVEFQKMGARGMSVLVASGDSGTGCSLCYYFQPSFPASSPFVTAVGGTQFAQSLPGPEAAAEVFHSGGGFSWVESQPVENYFAIQSSLPSQHFYQRDGRGLPDISALGVEYQLISSNTQMSYSSTSASTVTAAAIISLLNEIRLARSMPALGFLNPWLYQTAESAPHAFFDVTVGNNHAGCCGVSGFYAAPGWDPVTGLGTLNFEELAKIVNRTSIAV